MYNNKYIKKFSTFIKEQEDAELDKIRHYKGSFKDLKKVIAKRSTKVKPA